MVGSRKDFIQSELLVIRYLRGDEEAFEELVHLWRQPLFYYIRRLVDTEQDAWDTMQETWLTVSQKARRLREPAAFPAWLYKIARNAAIDHARKNRAFAPLPEEKSTMSTRASDTEQISLALDAERLHWGLAQLAPLHREVLILHFLEGFSLAEISDVTRVPLGTVKSRIHHAKQALRNVLEREAS